MVIDEVLARLIRRALIEDPRLSSQLVQVIVEQGGVRLVGRVRSPEAREAAGRIAGAFEGVSKVVNDLQVEAPVELADAAVVEQVRAALEAHLGEGWRTFRIDVHEGVVVLQGTVATDREALLAVDVVIGVAGVRAVRSALSTSVLDRIDDGLAARQIQSALDHTAGLEGHGIRVAVARGTISLWGSVVSAAQHQLAVQVASSFPCEHVRDEIRITAPLGHSVAGSAPIAR